MAVVKSISLRLTGVRVIGKLDSSSMAWKPPWVLYTSFARFLPGKLNILLVRLSLMQVHPQAAAAAADLDLQLKLK